MSCLGDGFNPFHFYPHLAKWFNWTNTFQTSCSLIKNICQACMRCHKNSLGSWDPLKNQFVLNMLIYWLQMFQKPKKYKMSRKSLSSSKSQDTQFLATAPGGSSSYGETGAPGYFGSRLWRLTGWTNGVAGERGDWRGVKPWRSNFCGEDEKKHSCFFFLFSFLYRGKSNCTYPNSSKFYEVKIWETFRKIPSLTNQSWYNGL